MAAGKRPQRNCALKRRTGTRSVTHLSKTLTARTGGFGIPDSDREAALGGQERRDGPAVKQLALPTVLSPEPLRLVAPTRSQDVLEIKDLWSVTGPGIPDVKP